jgi:hypothetical protein
MKDLPRFRSRDYDIARAFAAQMLTNHAQPQTALLRLTEREDNSFEAVFAARYFVLNEGETEPSKSQWNNLKKRFKRSEPSIFIFKDHGVATCPDGEPGCYVLYFGYFAERDPNAPSDKRRWSDRPGGPPYVQRPEARKRDTRQWERPGSPPRRKDG